MAREVVDQLETGSKHSKILPCTGTATRRCVSPFQDKQYGKGMRLHNRPGRLRRTTPNRVSR